MQECRILQDKTDPATYYLEARDACGQPVSLPRYQWAVRATAHPQPAQDAAAPTPTSAPILCHVATGAQPGLVAFRCAPLRGAQVYRIQVACTAHGTSDPPVWHPAGHIYTSA